jgi:hypothetical protein
VETFPESLLAEYPIKLTAAFKTRITDFGSGGEQRQQCWAFSKRRANIPAKLLVGEIKDLWKFYYDRKGAYETFWFYVIGVRNCYGEYVGTGDASDIYFDLPGKEIVEATLALYVDGVQAVKDMTATTWAASTAYSLGDYVKPTSENGYCYECTTAGTSGASEPTWPTTPGQTVADNTVIWTCRVPGFSFITGGGQSSSDRVQFVVAPATGVVITADFKGKLRLKARFAVDELSEELFSYMFYTVGIDILEVR